MRKIFISLVIICGVGSSLYAQSKTETRNIILVTLDGFRWQELFHGADPEILHNSKFVQQPESVSAFASSGEEGRRNILLPFFWNTVAVQGQLYGNRKYHNYMDCSNPYWFSYPGYHELLVGAADRKVCSNMKITNPNSTVLEFLLNQYDFDKSVAAFSTWDVFPYILRESTSGIMVNSGLELTDPDLLLEDENKLNRSKPSTGKRSDSITFHLAFEYLKDKRPRVLYIALGETDDNAHAGRYDQYLLAAHHADQWISLLWNWVQSQPGYRDHTTLLITTDHGRGQNPDNNWRHHSRFTGGSGQIWLAVLGPDTPAEGEMKTPVQLYQKQIAKTIAALVGLNYTNKFPVGSTISSIVKPGVLIAEDAIMMNPLPEIALQIK